MNPLQQPKKHLHLQKYSHHFSCTNLSPFGRDTCLKFARGFIAWSIKKVQGRSIPLKVYAASNDPRTEFRFHINCFDAFLKHLAYHGFKLTEYTVADEPLYIPLSCDLTINRELYEYQEEAMPYLMAESPRSKLLEFQTGKGKGTTAIYVVSKKATRVVIIVSANLMVKWAKEVRDLLGLQLEDILLVQGTNSLISMMEDAANNDLPYDVIIISSRTMAKYFEYYEENSTDPTSFKYPAQPWDFFKLLRAGVRITDECHLDFHFFYKLDLYTHIPYSLAMSATLVSTRDAFLDQMYRTMYPMDTRMAKLRYEAYATIYSLSYGFLKPGSITCERMGMYNQAVFEECLMSNSTLLESYLELVLWTVDRYFYGTHHTQGDKALIYAGTQVMCTLLTERLKKKYPTRDVRRYISGDPYDNVIDAEIRVTTLKSAGAAIDIPDLAYALCLVILTSERANLQALGRLRKRAGDKKVLYSYLFASNIVKHLENNAYRESVLIPKAKKFQYIPTGKIVG